MILQVLSVHDVAADAFGRPVFAPAVGAALRSFQDEVNRVDANNEMNKHPGDFSLFHLGTFDDSKGTFMLFDVPKKIASGATVKVQSELPLKGHGAEPHNSVIR